MKYIYWLVIILVMILIVAQLANREYKTRLRVLYPELNQSPASSPGYRLKALKDRRDAIDAMNLDRTGEAGK